MLGAVLLIFLFQLDSLFVAQRPLASPSCQLHPDFPLAVSTAENPITKEKNAQSLSPLNREAKQSKESSLIKDKYYDGKSCVDEFNECYEYKEGGKVSVRGRLKSNIEFWKCIDACHYIIDTIQDGYKIPFYSLPQQSFSHNNKSALQEYVFVQGAIMELLENGLISEQNTEFLVTNPLSVSVNSSGKRRLILDLREVNKHVWKQSVKYDDIRSALMYTNKNSWCFKFDITSAYHHVDIFPDHRKYLGFSWKFGVQDRYFCFNVLPFGLTSAPYIFTKLTRPLVKKWRREGKTVLMYLDDGFGCHSKYDEACKISKEVFERDLIQLPSKLREKVYALPGIMQASRADSTINKYCNSFLRFKKWAKEQGIEESELFPSKPLHVSIYLACLVQRANSPSPIVDAFYGIKWAHDLVGFDSPTDNQFVKNIMEGGKRIVAKPVKKKEPITVENLRCMYLKLFECNNLYNQRIICMVLLAFAGFLRSSELINIKRSDIQFLPDHIEIFIESSKTDIYRDGTRVVIARTFSYMCPVSNFELYLRLAGIQDDSEEYVFCAISKLWTSQFAVRWSDCVGSEGNSGQDIQETWTLAFGIC
nr:uncharacterized protein LOC105348263 isoform X2 [Crassostrea gigas]